LPADVYVADAACGEYNALAIILNSATITTAVYYTDDIFGDGSRWGWATACPVNSLGAWIQPDHIPGQYCFGYSNNNLVYRGDVTAGVMAVTLAPGSLAADHGQNHGWWMGAWLGAYSGVYLVSAMDISGTILPGFVYKTFDRFETNPVGLLRPSTVYPLDTYGTSTAVAATSLTDTLKTWAVNRYAGMIVSAGGRTGVIVSNTATKLTIVDWLGGADPVSPVAYAISLANARAFMTVPGASGAANPVTQGRVLIAALLHTSTHKFAGWRTGAGNWTTKVFDADELGAGTGGERVRALTANLWFILSNADYCNANNCIVRTKNGSAAVPTWDSVTTPKAGNDYWIDFAIDAGGRVWGVTCDIITTGHVVKIWYSDDDGDTWTESTSATGTSGNPLNAETLSCHPSNQNIIALRVNRGIVNRYIRIYYTLDRGASWGSNTSAGVMSYPAWPSSTGFKVCDNNRLILWYYLSGGDCRVSTSDDWGATWTTRQTFVASGVSTRVLGAASPSGQKAFAYTVEHEVWWCQDYGVTWVQFDNQPGGQEESGVAYDPVDDALYAFTDNNKTTNLLLVSKMMPVTQAGTWVDFSDMLLPIGADTHYLSAWCDQIAVIPR